MKIARAVDWPGLCEQVLAPLEVASAWNEEALGTRVDCYRLTRSPRLARAESELAQFRANQPSRVLDGLVPRP